MSVHTAPKVSVFSLIKNTLQIMVRHPIISVPFILLATIQLTALEILYFAPRQPLVKFFGPLITKYWSDYFLHYPQNFLKLGSMFSVANYVIHFLFIGIIIGMICRMFKFVNEEEDFTVWKTFTHTISKFSHLLLYSCVMVSIFKSMELLYKYSVTKIISLNHEAAYVKAIQAYLFYGSPFNQLFITILVTATLIYGIPAIVLDNKNFLGAFIENFKCFLNNPFKSIFIVLIPYIFYIPVFIALMKIEQLELKFGPETIYYILTVQAIINAPIEAIVYGTATFFYIFLKESKT